MVAAGALVRPSRVSLLAGQGGRIGGGPPPSPKSGGRTSGMHGVGSGGANGSNVADGSGVKNGSNVVPGSQTGGSTGAQTSVGANVPPQVFPNGAKLLL